MSDILKVLEHYKYELNSNNKMCCHLHGEKTPSFTYYPESDSYYCYKRLYNGR